MRPSPRLFCARLQASKVTCLIVSHDRGFLDNVVTDVVQLKARSLAYYKGDISSYVAIVAEQKLNQRRRYEAQQAERKHMQVVLPLSLLHTRGDGTPAPSPSSQ